MKGEQADYTLNLYKAFLFPKLNRVKKALVQIKKFVAKHTRAKPRDIIISNEVNEMLHRHSKNIPRKIGATLFREGGKVRVYLKDGAGLKDFLAKKEEEKKKAAEKKKTVKKEDAASVEDKEGEEEKRKIGEKKAKEEAARASEIKRKTGKSR